MLNIKKTVDGAKTTFALEGRVDTTTAPNLDAEINASISGVKELVLNFAGVEYISSAGLRVLLSAQKKMNAQGEMKVVSVSEAVMEVFEVTGFSDILTIE